MRFGSWLALLVIAQGCAGQSGATDRQIREHEERIKRLSANCDRLEERILALEAVIRSGISTDHRPPAASAERPDLPVVRVVPNGQKAESSSNAESPNEGVVEDTRRLTIVGEGSRVEARTPNENNAPVRHTVQSKSRASKGNQGTFSPASTDGAPQ